MLLNTLFASDLLLDDLSRTHKTHAFKALLMNIFNLNKGYSHDDITRNINKMIFLTHELVVRKLVKDI